MPVDLLRNVVRVDGGEWPLGLDLATGALEIRLPSATYVVRPLTWGEKRGLARYAFLGEDFVRRQLAATCAGKPELPDDEAQREALVAAAAWISAPRNDGLPLSPAVLLGVTIETSRWSGVPAADLDRQPSPDVEAFWRALGGETRRWTERSRLGARGAQPGRDASPASADLARPRTVRDDEPTSPASAHASAPLEAGWQRIVVVPDAAPQAPHDDAAAATDDDAGASAPPDPHAAAPAPWAVADVPPAPPSGRRAAPPGRRDGRSRFRVIPGDPQPTVVSRTSVSTGAPIVTGAPAHPGFPAAPPAPDASRPVLDERVEPARPPQSVPAASSPTARQSTVGEPQLGRVAPAMADTAALLDALAEELEEAASAIGIERDA